MENSCALMSVQVLIQVIGIQGLISANNQEPNQAQLLATLDVAFLIFVSAFRKTVKFLKDEMCFYFASNQV